MELIDALLLDCQALRCLSLSTWCRAFLAAMEQPVFPDLQDHLVRLAFLEKMEQLDFPGPRFVLYFTDALSRYPYS